MWGVGLLGPLAWLLVLATVVGVLFVVLGGRDDDADGRDRAIERLRERYARGDISDEEYEERASRLGNS